MSGMHAVRALFVCMGLGAAAAVAQAQIALPPGGLPALPLPI
jgi:hypothetical protein